MALKDCSTAVLQPDLSSCPVACPEYVRSHQVGVLELILRSLAVFYSLRVVDVR
jgi:hypothetical protein